MAVIHIYGLREPDTGLIRYIGKTTNPHRRWLNHLCEKSHCHRTCWIRALHRRGLRPEMVIIETVSGEWPWQESERFWIGFALKNDWPLVNMTSGGDGVPDWAAEPKRSYGDDHWTHRKPECLARGDNNGSRRHPQSIWRGSKCHSSKLTEADVREIRKRAASGVSHADLALQFSISRRNVWYIVNRKGWRHV
jgi:hypothetical protein